MKTYKFLAVILLIILLPSAAFAGTDYYVDCSATHNGNGSYSNPYNSLSAVNTARSGFSSGDGLYFKVATTCTLTSDDDRLRITWSGTSDDTRVTIGAYYGGGQFGLGGYNRPIIQGNNSYPNDYQGGFYLKDRSYVTIKDLRFEGIGNADAKSPKAIMVVDSNNINVENCYFYRSSYGSLEYGRVNTGIISDNVIEESGYPNWGGRGAAIEVTGANLEGATTNILVSRNYVFNSKHEGIGFYKKVENCIAEYNVVHDVRSFNMYIDAGKNITMRYNLIYESTDKIHPSFTESTYAIAVDNEQERPYFFSGGNKFYGNMIAGMKYGINLGCNKNKDDPSFACHEGVEVYNNTLVDNDANIRISRSVRGDSIDIKNNISLVTSEGSGSLHVGSNNYNAAGVTWDHNLFHGGATVTGNAATNLITSDPKLAKISDWRNIAPRSISGTEFLPNSDSPAFSSLNEGASDRALIYDADYTSKPIKIKIKMPDRRVIGAFIPANDINIQYLQAVKNVKIVVD